MSDLIDRNLIGDLVDSNGNVHYEDIMNIPSLELPSVQPVDKDINVSCKDAISRQAAIEAVETKIKKWNAVDGEGYHVGLGLRYTDVIDTLTELPSAQPEDCDTCKHGYFGDDQCERCRVRYPSHYERRTDGEIIPE